MTDDQPTLRDLVTMLPVWWYTAIRDEWYSRTRFGKLLFPFWLLESAFIWVFVLTVLLLAVLFQPLMNSGRDVDADPSWIIPDTHKDESGTQSSDGQPPQ